MLTRFVWIVVDVVLLIGIQFDIRRACAPRRKW